MDNEGGERKGKSKVRGRGQTISGVMSTSKQFVTNALEASAPAKKWYEPPGP